MELRNAHRPHRCICHINLHNRSVAGIYCSASLFLYYSRLLSFRQRSFQKRHERLYTKTIENNAYVIHKHYSYYYDSISITSSSVRVHRLNMKSSRQSRRPVPAAFVVCSPSLCNDRTIGILTSLLSQRRPYSAVTRLNF